MCSKKINTAVIVTNLIESTINDLGFQLWDVRFEKEGLNWYLRIFIDKDGVISIDDCEKVSRAIDKIIDDADPIEDSYFLEVSSPGIYRELVKDWHIRKYIGHYVNIKFVRPIDGRRDVEGKIIDFDKKVVTLELHDNSVVSFLRKDIVFIKLNSDKLIYTEGMNNKKNEQGIF